MEKILVFQNETTKSYWLKYILNFLSQKNINFKYKIRDGIIFLDDIKLIFISDFLYNDFMIGRHDKTIQTFHNVETQFENNFNQFLLYILERGEKLK